MRKVMLIAILAFIAMGMIAARTSKDEPKVFTLTLKDPELGSLWTVLEFSKQNLPTSEAKANDVSKATREIIALQEIIQAQVKAQTDTTKKDSSKAKAPIVKKK